jgi:hypothetical protein
MPGSVTRWTAAVSNPAPATAPRVSRLGWQPPAKRTWNPSRRSCRRATAGSAARTCSTSTSLPPGRRTRLASASAAAWSGTEHSTRVDTTVSTEASGSGSDSAGACRTVSLAVAPRAARKAARSMCGSGSVASTSTPAG